MNLLAKFHRTSAVKQEAKSHSNLQKRFIWRVLAPPFFVLIGIGLVIFWQLDSFVRSQAADELRRASLATAVKLEREFAIRQTVLKRTGEELFGVKSAYQADKTALEQNRTACAAHLKAKKTFQTAPNSACEPFLADFARSSATAAAVEDGYVRIGNELLAARDQRINDRLGAYKQFFPETTALIVVNTKQEVVSSALSGIFKGSTDDLVATMPKDSTTNLEGLTKQVSGVRLGLFSYPIESGRVLAAYDLGDESFVQQTWASTPIDKKDTLAVILDSTGTAVYPQLPFSTTFNQVHGSLANKHATAVTLGEIKHLAVGTAVGESGWQVAVASPTAAVLAPLRDAQLLAAIIIGSMLVAFLWVGTFFIQKTLRTIIRLVSGSLIFASGKLDYKIQLDHPDVEFASLATTMNGMAGRIDQAEKALDEKNKEFISIATHELRTPLTAIKGNLSMAYEDYGDQLTATTKPLIAQAFDGTTRLATLVNDMLDMARLDGNRVEFVIKPQDIKAIATDVVSMLQVTAGEKQVSLSYNPAAASPVLADATKLRIVLNNFVSNAIKYNRPGGTVTLTHALKDGKLVTAVADTGLGIPEDQKSHMFEKFFRVQNADRTNVVGTGLGMYITREYIMKMGGELWFESTHGQGTTFYFAIPIAPAPSVTTVPVVTPSTQLPV